MKPVTEENLTVQGQSWARDNILAAATTTTRQRVRALCDIKKLNIFSALDVKKQGNTQQWGVKFCRAIIGFILQSSRFLDPIKDKHKTPRNNPHIISLLHLFPCSMKNMDSER